MAIDSATATMPEQEVVDAFVAGIRGRVLQPGDDGYDEARTLWNGLIDRRPAFVAQCSGTADVVDAVNFAREHGLLLSVKGGGHGIPGNAVNDGGMVIDLSGMRGVHVDPATRTLRAQGGATWGDADREGQLFGLAVPGGVVSTTGIGGLTLHGGVGHLRRKHGLSIDNLVSVEIVTADGQVRQASASENEDLFWAVRGAGSNFGVVTSFEFQAHAVGPLVFVGAVFYPLAEAAKLLADWRDLMAEAPEEVSSVALLVTVPAHEPFPPHLHGAPAFIVAAAHAGGLDDGEAAIKPFRELSEPLLDMSGPWPWFELQRAFDGIFPKGDFRYWKSTALPALPGDAIAEIVEYANTMPKPLADVAVWHHGGAMSRVGETETAYAGRQSPFLVAAEASWTDRDETDGAIAWARGLVDALSRFSTGGLYLNFPGLGEDGDALVRAGYGANYDRLVELKTTYDPDNLFRMTLNIPPRR
jgi:FAD/FMN-containing dehydrogenase